MSSHDSPHRQQQQGQQGQQLQPSVLPPPPPPQGGLASTIPPLGHPGIPSGHPFPQQQLLPDQIPLAPQPLAPGPPSLGYSRSSSTCEPSEFSTPAAAGAAGGDEALILLPEVAATGRPAGSRRPFQRRRRSRACDACRARKTKCDTPDSGPCSACAAASLVCKFSEGGEDRRRAGPARRIRHLEAQVQDLTRKLQDAESQLMMVGANVATPRPIPGVVPPASDTSSPQFGSSGGTEQGWWGPHTQQHDPGGQGLELFHGDADRRSSLAHAYCISDSNPTFIASYRKYLRNLGYNAEIPDIIDDPGTVRVPLLSEYPFTAMKGLPLDLRVLLPPKPFADRLLAVFNKTVLQYTPIFCRERLQAMFERAWGAPLWEEDREMVKKVFCIVEMLMAVASQMVDTEGLSELMGEGEGEPPHLPERTGWKFFHLARKYADLNNPVYTPDDAMFLLLMSMYLDNASLPAPAWMINGSMARICQDLNLDKPPPSDMDIIEVESRKRLFWAAYIFERKACLKKGRAVIFRDVDIEIGPPQPLDPPTPTSERSDGIGRPNRVGEELNLMIVEAPDSIQCFRAQIHISRLCEELGEVRLEEAGGMRDLQTIQSIDEKLKTAWEEFPTYLTDLKNLEPLEMGALRPLFYLQYCRLLLYRFFTESTSSPQNPNPPRNLNRHFLRVCLAQSVQVAKITAHLIFRTSKTPGFDTNYGRLTDELVQLQTFRAAIILLLGYCSHEPALLAVSKEEVEICVRALHSVAAYHFSGKKLLQTFLSFATTFNYPISKPGEAVKQEQLPPPSQPPQPPLQNSPSTPYPPPPGPSQAQEQWEFRRHPNQPQQFSTSPPHPNQTPNPTPPNAPYPPAAYPPTMAWDPSATAGGPNEEMRFSATGTPVGVKTSMPSDQQQGQGQGQGQQGQVQIDWDAVQQAFDSAGGAGGGSVGGGPGMGMGMTPEGWGYGVGGGMTPVGGMEEMRRREMEMQRQREVEEMMRGGDGGQRGTGGGVGRGMGM